ncbi:sulfatase family protein [Lacipirellula sp.]|uniref:sulfatase family protein n=1 Tax=Lacipirellula sp. TaxID=2691419 RepID=UPI003D12B308
MHRFRTLTYVLLVVAVAPFYATAAERPNIVILYADDMGYGDLAVQNPAAKVLTPNLDALARQSLRFTDAHSSASICSPSRYALLTGRYHWRSFHGIVDSFGPSAFNGEATLPEVLRSAGYRTACIGKWHLGWNWNAIKRPGAVPSREAGYAPDAFDWSRPIPGGPLDHGFDEYFGDDVPNFPPYAWFENDRIVTPPSVPRTTPGKPAEGGWECRPGPMVEGWDFAAVMPTLTKRAVDWIGRQKGKAEPFFLYFPFTSPHAPMLPTSEYAGKSQVGGYGDYLLQTDATVGAVLAALKANGLDESTIVIFSSDNGPESYAYPRLRKLEHRSTGPWRGLKRDLYEGGHRVPLLVRWPGVVKPGMSDALVSQIDLFATLAAAGDAPIPAGAAPDSHNLLPLWEGTGPSPRHTIVHAAPNERYAIRDGDWVYIDAPTGNVTKAPGWFNKSQGYEAHQSPGELFDLKADPAQQSNLFETHPEQVAKLKAKLAEARR